MAARCLVTGVAGFIGSHLAERLLAEGYQVVGVDCFTGFYPRAIKEANLESLRSRSGFQFLEADLCTMDMAPLLQEMDYVLHEAGQAAVRSSWGREFMAYVNNNIVATQRLLEAAKGSKLHKFVFASSASVYSNTAPLPTREDAPLRPYSPYGVTKLAAENLCHLYHDNFGLPTIALRYFSVYGPRQRPDMALHRFIRMISEGKALPLYGDGTQMRNFTYVSDVAEANLLAMRSPVTGRAFNIGGGSRATVNQAIALLEEIIGKEAIIDRQNRQHGDVSHTWADTTAAEQELGFRARVDLREGLTAEVNWLRQSLYRNPLDCA